MISKIPVTEEHTGCVRKWKKKRQSEKGQSLRISVPEKVLVI